MTATETIQRVFDLFRARGGNEYHGEAVTQLEHALQAAYFAEQEQQPPEVIVSALLHDVGHMLHGHGEDYLDHGLNDRHEDLGARFLSRAFGPAVTEPIRLHVPAKRYLSSGKHPQYPAILSPASLRSLELQGGTMNAEEIREFENNPHFAAAAKIREYDDRAKIVGFPTPAFSHFAKYIEQAARPASEPTEHAAN
jgi:phosphonate degradation associated HDIG domain protein